MKILYVGDIMAEMGMRAVERVLPDLVRKEHIDFVVAQAENVTGGKGMSPEDMVRLRRAGVQAFSGGNHTPYLSSLVSFLENPAEPVVGPANMVDCPGPGYKLVDTPKGAVLLVSLLGSIVGKQADVATENPLKTIDRILDETVRGPTSHISAIVVNLHGDFSSEKIVFGHYLDGRVSVVVGDHWHVPTADAQVLPKGTAHITDVGMCGSLDSSLGVSFGSIVPRWRDGLQTRNHLETTGRMQFNALLIEVDEVSARATSARHLREVWATA